MLTFHFNWKHRPFEWTRNCSGTIFFFDSGREHQRGKTGLELLLRVGLCIYYFFLMSNYISSQIILQGQSKESYWVSVCLTSWDRIFLHSGLKKEGDKDTFWYLSPFSLEARIMLKASGRIAEWPKQRVSKRHHQILKVKKTRLSLLLSSHDPRARAVPRTGTFHTIFNIRIYRSPYFSLLLCGRLERGNTLIL